jgi:hypothetical protein
MSYMELEYAEVQALAKERGLNAKGTKEELVARLEESDGTPATTEETVPEEVNVPEIPESTPAPETVTEAKVAKELTTDIQRMKAHLDAQRKVSIMIPLEPGMSQESADLVPFTVNMNGYQLNIRRGVFVEVPEQVADMIKARLESEGKIGSQFEIGNNASKVEALG